MENWKIGKVERKIEKLKNWKIEKLKGKLEKLEKLEKLKKLKGKLKQFLIEKLKKISNWKWFNNLILKSIQFIQILKSIYLNPVKSNHF